MNHDGDDVNFSCQQMKELYFSPIFQFFPITTHVHTCSRTNGSKIGKAYKTGLNNVCQGKEFKIIYPRERDS